MIRLFSGKHRLEWCYFLALWCFYGLLINTANLGAYNLQQVGVEAIAQRGHFYLEGSKVPILQNFGDAFDYNGHSYAAKQPGQFMLGAVAYTLLYRVFGLSYEGNWVLTAAFVTFLSSSSMAALTSLFVFKLARHLQTDGGLIIWPLSVALIQGLATTTLTYSGIAHHDVIATGCLMGGIYYAYLYAHSQEERVQAKTALISSIFLGYAITSSMLVFFMTAVVGIYLLSMKRWRHFPLLGLGFSIGIAPLLFYNWVSFGSPFLVSYMAGNFEPNYFHWDYQVRVNNLHFYLRALLQYVPILFITMLGVFSLRPMHRRFLIICIAIVFILFFYLVHMPERGGCMYGPRYLMPAMPLLVLFAIGVSHVASRGLRLSIVAILSVGAAYSATANLAGAMKGSMNCAPENYQVTSYLSSILRGELSTYPLFFLLIAPFAASCIALAISLRDARLHQFQNR